jgi:DNA-binding transcriptional MocR family regulator
VTFSAEELGARIEDRSSAGIARAVGRMVTSGALDPGTLMPPVRALAGVLGVSPMTISGAWKVLAADGLLSARGRAGTVVLDPTATASTARRRRIAALGAPVTLDLSTGGPDPALLPDLAPALSRLADLELPDGYQSDPVLPRLERVLRKRWPFPPGSLTVVDGAGDALDRIVSLVVRRGSPVVVEDPGYPPLLDLLDAAGAELVGVGLDGEGIRPDSLRQALRAGPVAVFAQPRAQNPTGASMSAARARELARLLEGTDVVVVEDDHSGDIATAPAVSIGRWLPEATVQIASFSKSHGPDLRLAAVGGSARVVDAIAERRLLGAGWSSRLLQHVLADLLVDPAAISAVRGARRTYTRRRRDALGALTARGVRTAGGDGINLWVEVADEDRALATLLAAGIGAARGSVFVVSPSDPHIRLTVGRLSGDTAAFADAVAAAAAPPPRRVTR